MAAVHFTCWVVSASACRKTTEAMDSTKMKIARRDIKTDVMAFSNASKLFYTWEPWKNWHWIHERSHLLLHFCRIKLSIFPLNESSRQGREWQRYWCKRSTIDQISNVVKIWIVGTFVLVHCSKQYRQIYILLSKITKIKDTVWLLKKLSSRLYRRWSL